MRKLEETDCNWIRKERIDDTRGQKIIIHKDNNEGKMVEERERRERRRGKMRAKALDICRVLRGDFCKEMKGVCLPPRPWCLQLPLLSPSPPKCLIMKSLNLTLFLFPTQVPLSMSTDQDWQPVLCHTTFLAQKHSQQNKVSAGQHQGKSRILGDSVQKRNCVDQERN